MAASDSCPLYTLPNELLLHILLPFPTLELLKLAPVSCRLHDLVLRIIHTRLTIAANLHDHTLLLECYHPSQKLTEPPLFCTHIGTDGLADALKPRQATEEQHESTVGRLGDLQRLYTRFRPRRRISNSGPARRRAGDIPGSRTHPDTSGRRPSVDENELVKQGLSLEAGELFTQLCAQVNLAKAGPRPGIFLSFVEVADGVARLFRDWLGHMSRINVSEAHPRGVTQFGRPAKGKSAQKSSDNDSRLTENILWVNPNQDVGLKLKVKERKWRRDNPILFQSEEEVAVSYDIEYEELLVRTAHLLLNVEQSLLQESNHSGKAVVFANFR